MASFFPGRGRKKPLNQLQAPIAPDIRAAPPRFLWTKKHWKVDTGRTMAEIEHIPQFLENGVLQQSYDYGSQHAYGKYPTYDVFTNLEFRPPLIERDDIMPLSRIPRPTIVGRINPGTAHPSGGSAFADNNMHISGISKNISDRVKEGDVRPTFFAPIDMPVDNSVLPDLETTIPSISASAGCRTTFVKSIEHPEKQLNYTQYHPTVLAGSTPIPISFPDSRENMSLDYVGPQISGSAGIHSSFTKGLTPVDYHLEDKQPQISGGAGFHTRITERMTPVDMDLSYNLPQISGGAGHTSRVSEGLTPVDLHFDYNQPQISGHAGYHGHTVSQKETPITDLETKLVGSQPAHTGSKMTPLYDLKSGKQESSMRIGEQTPQYSYNVPSNTRYKSEGQRYQPEFRQKAESIGFHTSLNPSIPQSYIPRAGISQPQIRMGMKK